MDGNADTRFFSALSLFTSVGTLVCCALPTLLVALGFGATVASLVSAVPFLVTLSHYKGWVFLLAALLIGTGFAYRRWLAPHFMARRLACSPDDPRCRELDRLSGVLLWVSVTLWVVGAAVAYGLPLVFVWLDV